MTLKSAREMRGLTQQELAKLSGLAQATISALENGRVQYPSLDTVTRLCRVLRVKSDVIFPVAVAR